MYTKYIKAKNVSTIFEDSTAFYPNRCKQCATQGIHIADGLWFIIISFTSLNLPDIFVALSYL